MKKTLVAVAFCALFTSSYFAYAGENSEKIPDWKSWVCTEEIIMSANFSRSLCSEPNLPNLPVVIVWWKPDPEPLLLSWGANPDDQSSVENIRVALRTDFGWVIGRATYFDFMSGGGQVVVRLYSDREKNDQIAERLIIFTPRGMQ